MKKFNCYRLPSGQAGALLLELLILCSYAIALYCGKLRWNPWYLLRQTTTMGFFVLGVGTEMTLGDVDLCFMAQASVGTLVLTMAFRMGVTMPCLILMLLVCQCLIGTFRGWVTSKLHIPMIVSSFAMAQILSNICSFDDSILFEGSLRQYFSRLQVLALFLLLVCAVGLDYFWKRTYWGKYSMAIGENRAEVERSGINVIFVVMVVYLLASVMFSFGTVMIYFAAPYGSSNRNADYLYQCLAAACLAGGLRNDWPCKAAQLVASTTSVVLMRQLLTAFGMNDFQIIAEGVVILLMFFTQQSRKYGVD